MTTPHQRTHLRRPSISSRLSFAISTHSAETAREDAAGAQEHVEEIEEIRRYEVCPPFADRKRRGGGSGGPEQDFTTIGSALSSPRPPFDRLQ